MHSINRNIIWGGIPTEDLIWSLQEQEEHAIFATNKYYNLKNSQFGMTRGLEQAKAELDQRLEWESFQLDYYLETDLGHNHPTTHASICDAEQHPLQGGCWYWCEECYKYEFIED